MTRVAVLLLTAVPIGVLAFSAPARACSPPFGGKPHNVVPSMQATDQVLPTLPAIPDAEIHRSDGSGRGGCGPDCPDLGRISIAAVATDDMTAPGAIGYRFTLRAGALPAGFTLPTFALDAEGPFVSLFWSDDDSSGDAFDFTLQVVAIDLAGNESAPQTVRVHDDPPGLCAVARGGVSPSGRAALVMAALLLAARRRRRRTP
jgi:MYXO-CTERM domain-containing protein